MLFNNNLKLLAPSILGFNNFVNIVLFNFHAEVFVFLYKANFLLISTARGSSFKNNISWIFINLIYIILNSKGFMYEAQDLNNY